MKRIGIISVLILGAAIILLQQAMWHAPGVSADPNEDLLSLIAEGCTAAADSIDSGSGRVTYHLWMKQPDGAVQEAEGVYQLKFAGQKFRYTEEWTVIRNSTTTGEPATGPGVFPPGTRTEASVSYDGQDLTSWKPAEKAAHILDPQLRLTDVRVLAYETRLKMSRNGVMPLDYYIAADRVGFDSTAAPRVIGREVVNGDNCIVAEMSGTRLASHGVSVTKLVKVWVNPEKGFTVPRTEMWMTDGKTKVRVMEVEADIRQYPGGMWAPEKCTRNYYHPVLGKPETFDEKVRTETVTYAADFQFNVPITDSDFSLQLPAGTKVFNDVLNLRYTVQ